VTVGRLVGGLLALVAVGVALSEGIGDIPVWMLLLPFAAGAGIAWQQATNGRLRQRVGTPLTATLVNFVGGTLLLVAAAIARVAMAGLPRALPPDLWLYAGGAVGVVYIFLSAALVAHTGVLLLGLGSVVGLLTAAVALDAAWPAEGSPDMLRQLVMVAIALLSVVVATAPRRRRT
jgi:transporter family-2 protein